METFTITIPVQTEQPKRKTVKKSKYYKINLAMYRLFSIAALASFVVLLAIINNDGSWATYWMVFFFGFLSSIFGGWYFYNPKRARYNMRRGLGLLILSFIEFCEQKYAAYKRRKLIRYLREAGYTQKQIYRMLMDGVQVTQYRNQNS